jgi:TnpA family transposase
MQNWHRQFLGRTQMPPTLSGFVINEFFTLRQSELQAVLSRYGVDMRVGAALQIGFLKMCGRALDKFQRVPFAVLEHLNAQVGGSPPDLATLRAFYSKSPRILYRHQQLALDVLGLVRFEAEADAPRVLEAICDKVRAGIDADQLLTEIRVILYDRRFVLPAPRVVGDLARRARETVERGVSAAIERSISPATRARWVEQLFELRADGMPCIEFLQEPPGALNPSSITREAEKVRTLLEMKVSDIPDLPGTEKYWQMYASKMRNQRPSRFAQRKEPRRSIELVGFLRHSLGAHTDTLIRMVDRRVSQLWGRASKKAKADQGALPALTVLLAGVRQAIGEKDKSKDARFDAIVDLVRRYDEGDLKPASIAARQRALLVKQIQQIRPLLKSLVGLDLKADDASEWPALIAGWKEAYARGIDGLTKAMTPPESPIWTTLREDPNTSPRNAAEVQLLWELRQALRRRTVHVPTSLSYQAREAMLDPRGSKITAPRSDYGVERMTEELTADIEDGLERVSEAVKRGELRLDGAKVIVRRLAAQRTPPELKDIRRHLYKSYPRVQFPDLIMDVDAQTHFSAEILGRPADNETDLQHLYAGILGQAMDLSANRLSLMVGLSPEGLVHAMHLLEDAEPLRRANEAILTFMHSHGIARTWGSPFDCAADAMSLDMPEYIWYTSPDPKRRVQGAATYVHTHGRQGIFSDRAILITQRQSGPAIDGILGQEISKIVRIYTDTHGFSAYGASLGWILGILMCPRLKNFNDRRLHIPTGGKIRVPENLKDVVVADVSLKAIEKGWAGHLKVADAVMSGRISATEAIEMQGAARSGDASFRAGHSHGLLLRTNDLLRSYTDPDYRREKLRYLNHNERTHQLQRQIRHAGSGSTRGKRQEELGAQSHCLALCTNLVMAYNTNHLQRTLDTFKRQSGREIDAKLLRHIAPMGFEHINFNGVIVFPFAHYRTQLFAQGRARSRRSASGGKSPPRPGH